MPKKEMWGMLHIPEETGRRFEAAMAVAAVAVQERWYHRKWLRYYLDFCAKYGRPAAEETSLGPFIEKLASKNQSAAQLRQAAQAVRLYTGMLRTACLPRQLQKKYPNAGREFIWQWFFPAPRLTLVEATGKYWRYHVLDSDVQKAVKRAADAAGVPKRVTPHTFRHTFASHLLLANVDIRTIQERLGHSDLKTTMIYTHTVPSRTFKDAGSPLDLDPETEESAGAQP